MQAGQAETVFGARTTPLLPTSSDKGRRRRKSREGSGSLRKPFGDDPDRL
jgi:hypothetical protein